MYRGFESHPFLQFLKIMDLHEINKKSKMEIERGNALEEHAASTNFNPLEWSKWLYEIRQQLYTVTSRSEAYEDCHQHFVEFLDNNSRN